MIYLGIDPGVTGAVGVVTSDGDAKAWNLPTKVRERATENGKVRRCLDPVVLCELLNDYDPLGCVVVVERTQAGMKGAIANYSLGHSSGVIMGVLAALGFKFQEVRPQEWKRTFGLLATKAERGLPKQVRTKQAKGSSRKVAQALFPGVSLDRVKDDGLAEALLLAEWGRRVMEGTID